MTKAQRIGNVIAVVLPFAAFVAAIALLWNRAVDATDLLIMLAMYLVTATGITIGYHRLLTHRAFQTYRPIEYAFAIAGSMAVQGPVIDWTADHRKHHAHTDEEGDPHSPHVGHGSGLRGLWHAHVGWLFETNGQADRRKYAPDLMDDPGMRWLNRHFLWLVGLSLALPFAAGLLITGSLARRPDRRCSGAASCGSSSSTTSPGRSTRSATSTAPGGSRPTTSRRTSGGSRRPRSARPGTTTTTPSPAPPSTACAGGSSTPPGLLILAMRRLGLAWNVVLISKERQAQKLAANARRHVRGPPRPATPASYRSNSRDVLAFGSGRARRSPGRTPGHR